MASKSRKGRKDRAKKARQPDFNTKTLWFAVFFAVAGVLLSLYATSLTFKIAAEGVTGGSGCSINDWINCDLAHSSSYARLLGIPVAWWGLLFYVFAGFSALYGAMTEDRRNAASYIGIAWIMTIGAVAFSLYKATNLWELRVLCPVCVGMYLANFGLLFTLLAGMNFGVGKWRGFLSSYLNAVRGEEGDLNFSPRIGAMALALSVLFVVGYVGIRNYERSIVVVTDFDMDLAIRAHFRQTPVAVNYDPEAAVWGNPDAQLTIVEFADFECPACAQSAAHLRPTLWEFRNNIKYVFMNFPLSQHSRAPGAASASICAGEFGDFWEFHDQLFENQISLGNQLYSRMVKERGWDEAAFAECVASAEVADRIERDIAAGRATRLESTPTILVNGRRISYWDNSDFIRAVIREELSRQ